MKPSCHLSDEKLAELFAHLDRAAAHHTQATHIAAELFAAAARTGVEASVLGSDPEYAGPAADVSSGESTSLVDAFDDRDSPDAEDLAKAEAAKAEAAKAEAAKAEAAKAEAAKAEAESAAADAFLDTSGKPGTEGLQPPTTPSNGFSAPTLDEKTEPREQARAVLHAIRQQFSGEDAKAALAAFKDAGHRRLADVPADELQDLIDDCIKYASQLPAKSEAA